ncbi:transposase family protein [Streptomyces sp. NPDC091416]|uniref:transposase family protein n=1 Tax=Streptomyces sp. NPDC091416 TaxID=3366003 RepID=UPI003830C608
MRDDQPGSQVLWLSPALPGRTHDLTASRIHKILRICERQGIPVLADMAYIGAGEWVTNAKRRPPKGELTLTQRTRNRALSAARAPVERGVARLTTWQIPQIAHQPQPHERHRQAALALVATTPKTLSSRVAWRMHSSTS